MNREFVYDHAREHVSWSLSDSLTRWSWSILCCGLPGMPCSYCKCCNKHDEEEPPTFIIDTETIPVPTCERELPHRPQALRGRKSTPELMSAVKCALNELQGQPAPKTLNPEQVAPEKKVPEIEVPEREAQDAPEKTDTG